MKLFAVVPLFLLSSFLPGFKHLARAPLAITGTAATAVASPTASSATATAVGTAAAATPVPATPGTPVPYNGACLTQPYNTISQCPVPPTPTRALIAPNKTLSVSGGTSGPAGSTTYQVTVVSKFVCFALNEPVDLYSLAQNPNAVAITGIQPQVPSSGSSISLMPDPATGTDTLLLEVFKDQLGSAGLDLKAVWPFEGVERVASVVAPSATSAGGAAATGTAVPIPGVTPTPGAAVQAFSLRACVDPNPVTSGGTATLYAQTLPGAVCTASVVTPVGTPGNFNGASQTALGDGLVVFPFTVGQTAGQGTAVVTCTYNGQTLRTTTTFTINPPPGVAVASPAPVGTAVNFSGRRPTTFQPTGGCPPPAQTGRVGLFVLTCLVPNPVASGATAVIEARTVPGARCAPSVMYSDGSRPTSLNTSAQYADPTGMVSFAFTAQSLAPSGTATVTCTLGVETAQGSTGFVITH